ncbi:MAG: S8 family serine peptidase [Anaerolineae bacterium]|jgi:thermitase
MERKGFNPSTRLSRLASVVLLALLLLAGVQPLAAQRLDPGPASGSPDQEYAPGQLLVRFRTPATGRRAVEMLAAQGISRLRRIEALDVDVLRLPPELPVEEAVAVFDQMPEVEYAEPNYILRVAATPQAEVEGVWNLQQIQAPAAWDLIGDRPPVLLAVVDTGVDRTHSDLANNIWANPGEVPGNGLDDDGNGYVDDTWGWDFYNGDNDPDDDFMHGTAVSSLAAGVQDGAGVAGVCPWCQIVSVKVLGSTGSGTLDMVAQGIVYAADLGARVINLSLGAPAGSLTLENAVDEAWSKGALVVAAAGNDGAEILFYPAAYANAMAIAATNDQDRRACLSNYGQGFISVAAPGEAIQTAIPNQGYGTYSGTSLAAPHVSALAGLLFSHEPGLSHADARARIESTVEDLGPVGTDAFYGTGRINAVRAVTNDTTPTTPPPGLYTDDPSATGYAHARKLARDPAGTLHWVWHGREGGQYQVLYATSVDNGTNWTEPEVVFASTHETYHPALALGEDRLYVAFPSKHDSAEYRTLFTWKPLSGGSWQPSPLPLLGGAYDAVRPALHVDDSGRLHVMASSLDDKEYIYYTSSSQGGAAGSWSPVRQIDVGYASRYASLHANGDRVYVAGRTVEFTLLGLLPRYRLFTVRSTDGGATWDDLTELEVYDGWLSGEYGVSLAGVGDRLYLAYEHSGNIYVRDSHDGASWSSPYSLGAGAWPSLTQTPDGQAWVLWVRDPNLVLRHYTGAVWGPEIALGAGSYPNLKLGAGSDLVEWVATQGGCAPLVRAYGSRAVDANSPPVAVFSYECDGLTCAFDAANSDDPDGTLTSYQWAFGDDSTGNGVTASHAYLGSGTYTVTLTVTDNDGATGTDSQDVSVGPGTMHVGDLDGDRSKGSDQWDAQVTVTIHDGDEKLVPGATVHGTWSGGITGGDTCVTAASGQCQMARTGILAEGASVVFTVEAVSHATLSYDPAANHDTDGDSNGTTITIHSPAKHEVYLPLVVRSVP